VQREFPTGRTSLNSIRWYRWKDGVKSKGERPAHTNVAAVLGGKEHAEEIKSARIDFSVLKKEGIEQLASFKAAHEIAEELLRYLQQAEVQQQIRERHVLCASSALIQELILQKAASLGFEDEKQGLFADCGVPGLRPDYYCRTGNTGILLEVERGKTTSNNMDLLDLWKCHICEDAEYLFLLVPQARPSANGTVLRHFQYVQKRLAVFFEPKNYVNVNAVHLFGY
jgi:hypothetical protein